MALFLHVISVRCVRQPVLELKFDDGSRKQVDLAAHLWGQAFEPLHDPEYFSRVRVNPATGTIEWPNGADFAPEFLHEIGVDLQQLA